MHDMYQCDKGNFHLLGTGGYIAVMFYLVKPLILAPSCIYIFFCNLDFTIQIFCLAFSAKHCTEAVLWLVIFYSLETDESGDFVYIR